MTSRTALDSVGSVAEQQYGLFTTQQAESVGVPRLTLSRLNADGLLKRVTHGVYRVHGAPRDIHEDLRADWLALDPARTGPERLRDRDTSIAVSHRSAASVHGIGDLPAGTHHFTSATRKQSSRARVTVPRTPLASASVEIVEGLPVTTIERTIADLARTEADVSHAADAAGDADARGALRHDILALELESVAARIRAASGPEAVQHLLEYRGLDSESLANIVLATKSFQASLDAVRESIAAPALDAMATAIREALGQRAANHRMIVDTLGRASQDYAYMAETVLAHIRPTLEEYAATQAIIAATVRPALQEIARNAYSPGFAALRSTARASSSPSTPAPADRA